MWQRWNSTSKIFEKSDDDGGSWTALGLDAAIITQGTFNTARIPSLDTSILTSGTLGVPRGGIGVATLAAHGVLVGNGTSGIVVVSPSSSGQYLKDNGAGADPSFAALPAAPTQYFERLGGGSGTNTVNGATTDVSTLAISGLTVDDQLVIHVMTEQVTQPVARIDIASVTDAVVIARLTLGGAVSAGVATVARVLLMCGKTATSVYNADTSGGTTGGPCDETRSNTGMTAWTGSWTLSLQEGSVSVGGTNHWRWQVYKVRGQ